MPLNVAQVRAAAREIRQRGLRYAAVTAMFSPLTSADEEAVAGILREEVPDIPVTCSHLLGGIGLLERENAALLNTALIALARETIKGFEDAMRDGSVEAPRGATVVGVGTTVLLVSRRDEVARAVDAMTSPA